MEHIRTALLPLMTRLKQNLEQDLLLIEAELEITETTNKMIELINSKMLLEEYLQALKAELQKIGG